MVAYTRQPVATSVRRLGIVYGINAIHPATGQVVLGYVGKTRQRLLARERQHRDDQPWSDTIVGEAFIIEQGMWTEPELDAREQWHIGAQLPLFNIEYNEANPGRVKPWDAVTQRQAREPEWVPVAKAPRQRRAPAMVVSPFPASGSAWVWFRRSLPVQLAVTWLVLLGALTWAAAGRLDGWDPAGAGMAGAVASFLLALVEGRTWARLWRGLTGPKRRRRRR